MPNDAPAPQSAQPGSTRQAAESMSGDALARRRALIKGLGKGAAAIAVVAPIQSLAATSNSVLITQDNTLCTLSGQMSNVMSRALANAATCTGYMPTHYWKLGTKKDSIEARNWPTLPNNVNSFRDIFGGSDNTKLLDVLYGTNGNPSDNSYWVAAYFNADELNTGAAFPYTQAEVVAQYSSANVSNYLQFYKIHLSNLG